MKSDKNNSLADSLLDWAETVVFAVFMVLLCFMFVFRIATVNGESMENTLFQNDKLVISHLLYTPKQGDIVVINSDVMEETIIKRIVAVQNQKVVIDCKKGTITVDGKFLDEPYVKEDFLSEANLFAKEFYNSDNDTYEYKVPFGYVFVLGDNRNKSTDSRRIGFVPKSEIVGRVVFRFYSEKAGLGKVS